MKRMNLAQRRRMALGVMNYNQRHAPSLLSAEESCKVLDDWARKPENTDTIAAEFWQSASDYQIKLLKRDFRRFWKDSDK